MRILNAMFSKGLGGIEQSFVDYTDALCQQGHQVTALIHPQAEIRHKLSRTKANIETIRNFGWWDPFASANLAKRIKAPMRNKIPDVAIAHGNRAVRLLKRATKGRIPIAAVTHNYSIKHMIGLDAIFTITEDLREKVIAAGHDSRRTFHIPNMINLSEPKRFAQKHPPPNPMVIGTMGRFVKKKGFSEFIEAIALLNKRELPVPFKIIIGGDGEEAEQLVNQAYAAGLESIIEFPGWIDNKKRFFEHIHIFCLPSLHEPFGIILLEAFAHNTPVITTASEGPSEIAHHDHDSLMVPIAAEKLMADAIERLICDQELREDLAQKAKQTVQRYSMTQVGQKLETTLRQIIKNHK